MTEILNADLVHAHFIKEFLNNPRPKEQLADEIGIAQRTLDRFMHKVGKTDLYTLAKINKWLEAKDPK